MSSCKKKAPPAISTKAAKAATFPFPVPSKTHLSSRGYAIDVEGNQQVVSHLKEVCTVKPVVNPNAPGAELSKAFPIYRESSKKLYIPRALGLELMGPPARDTLGDGVDAPGLVFHGKLRPEQEGIIDAFLRAARDPVRQGGIVSVGCGGGKCLGKDTPVMMHDGAIKPVQDIQVGDRLMGDDSTPRRVLSTCRGTEKLYRVVQERGDPYVVNESHILSLKRVPPRASGTKAMQAVVVDMGVSEYLSVTSSRRDDHHLFGYRVPVDFPARDVPTDPYLVGCGAGAPVPGVIPGLYKFNSRSVRLEVLAGLIDTHGYYSDNEDGFVLALATDRAMHDALYVARSLGFWARESRMRRRARSADCAAREDAPLLRCVISGRGLDQVPVWAPAKRAPRRACGSSSGVGDEDVLLAPLQVEPLGVGAYYGFEIDGNRRFLLGDFTVTHNTTMSLYIAAQLGKKTLVVCHKEFLINQWRERISQFLPQARVGLIKAKVVDVDDKDIVIASLQSIAMKEYDPALFDQFGLVAIDEVHHTSAEVFSRALPKITSRVMLGLSATLDRRDGLRKVFEWHLGGVVHDLVPRKDKDMTIEMVDFSAHELEEVHMWNGKLNVAAMVNNLCACPRRNQVIMDKLEEVMRRDPGRRVLILSDRRAHLQHLADMVKQRGLGTTGFYVGGMKEAELDKSAKCDVILGTNMMAAEGMDIPALNTLVLASPVSSVEQQLGRVQRQKPHERKYIPYTIDVWDDMSIFKNQGIRRRAFYKKAGYTITSMASAASTASTASASEGGGKEVQLPSFAFLDA